MEQLAGWIAAGFFYLSLFSPLPQIALVWKRLMPRPADHYAVAIAIAASLSYGLLLAALLYKSTLLGADHSHRLFTTVAANTALALTLSILAAFRNTAVRGLLTCSAFTISLAWFLFWVVNATA